MLVSTAYDELGTARHLSEEQAAAIVDVARSHALAALGRGGEAPAALAVSAQKVDPAAARGGSLIPAWPLRQTDGSVRIEFVDDWGVMLAAWRTSFDAAPGDTDDVNALLKSGERIWVGIANDVLQLFVPDPPSGTYSMVRHHGLMLAAATVWLGPEPARRWRAAHSRAATAFLRRAAGRPLWDAIEEAERCLDTLLAAPAGHTDAASAVAWLDADPDAGVSYAKYLGAASLGVAALLEDVATETGPGWLEHAVREEHARPDFNRVPIERFARRISE